MNTLLVPAILVTALDQAAKAFVLAVLREGRGTSLGPIAIRRVTNHGRGDLVSRPRILLMLWITEVMVLLLLVYLGPLFQNPVAQAGLGASVGGAAGNLFDRLSRGKVVDFIDLGFWPVFNLADMAIVGGVLTAMLFAI